MVLISRSSDRRLERRWHATCAGVIGAAALVLVSHPSNQPLLTVALLTVAATGIAATNVLVWSLATDYLHGSPAAAGTIAFINCIGLLSGFVSPFIIGWLKTLTGTLVSGLYTMTALLILGIVVMLVGLKPRETAAARASTEQASA
jgi:nitrate/nitrite transporter NarK